MNRGAGARKRPDESKGQEMSSAQPRSTDTLGQYLAFIDAHGRVHGRPLATTDMQRRFQVRPPSVHQMVLTLERRVDPATAGSRPHYRGAGEP